MTNTESTEDVHVILALQIITFQCLRHVITNFEILGFVVRVFLFELKARQGHEEPILYFGD